MDDIAAWTERILALRRELEYDDELDTLLAKLREEVDEALIAFRSGTDAEFLSEIGDVMVVKFAIKQHPSLWYEERMLKTRGLSLTDAMEAAEDKLTARVAAKREG